MSFDPNQAALPGSGIFGLPDSVEEAHVIVVPIPWDATTSYRAGTSRGPQAILEASRQVDLFDIELGRPYTAKIAMCEADAFVARDNEEARRLALPILEAAGQVVGHPDLEQGLRRVNELGANLNAYVYTTITKFLAQGKMPIVLGGDHSCPLGAMVAYAERYPGLGVLHFDAHADLRNAYESFEWSHASIMYNVLRDPRGRAAGLGKLVQVGIRDLCEEEMSLVESEPARVATFFDADLARARISGRLETEFRAVVDELPKYVYVSFDIDALDPKLCPHTGTPVPGGLAFGEASMLLGMVAESGRQIVGFDLNEVAPGPDGDDWDANVGARVLYKLIGWSLLSQGRIERPARLRARRT